ncbi:hypothetical protein D3C78_1960870 [compost metagenome]
MDARLELVNTRLLAKLQANQTHGQTDEGAEHADGHQEAGRGRQQAAAGNPRRQGAGIEEMLGI